VSWEIRPETYPGPPVSRQAPSGVTSGTTSAAFPAWWRRPLALALDVLTLALVGIPLGIVFFEPLSRLGPWGRGVGFVIALLYFGILNSRLGGGQTVGKRILGDRVVGSTGSPLTLSRSILRYLVLGVPWCIEGLALPTSRIPPPATVTLSVFVCCVDFTVIYLYFFNRPSRRSLHDLLSSSMVVRARAATAPPAGLWRGHVRILAAVLSLIAFGFVVLGNAVRASGDFPAMMQALADIESAREVQSASVFLGRSTGKDGGKEYVRVIALLRRKPDSAEDSSDRIAAAVLKALPGLMSKDRLVIILEYGFDIGIARAVRSIPTSLPPQEWARRVSGHAELS
jgi:uncharacterized RDD family membrane protein YckC